ncbi:MAG: hypothetical protein PW792_16895 [Acidobacteriaceae bacterium]|nr:hypothetical protein [Acidobacteriaceae bacterium]
MKWIFALVVLVLVVFIVVKRDQLYVRDPLAKVTHNGIEEEGAQVFINFNNEVYLENDNPPMHIALIQQNNHVGVPKQIQCLHWVACMVDAPVATLLKKLPITVESMDAKKIVYHDAAGTQSAITLR